MGRDAARGRMSDTFVLSLIGISILSVLLLFYPSSSSPPPGGGSGTGGPVGNAILAPFVSVLQAVWRCVEVLGVGIAVLVLVGGGIFLFESAQRRFSGEKEGGEGEGRWQDTRKERRARLRHGQAHGLGPIVFLLVGLIASSFIDLGVLTPSFLSTSSSSSHRSASREYGGQKGGEFGFAFIVVAVIVVATVLLRRDFSIWKTNRALAKQQPPPSTPAGGSSAGAAAEAEGSSGPRDVPGGSRTGGRQEPVGREGLRPRRVPPAPSEEIEMKSLRSR